MSYLCSKPYLTQRTSQSPKWSYAIGLPILSKLLLYHLSIVLSLSLVRSAVAPVASNPPPLRRIFSFMIPLPVNACLNFYTVCALTLLNLT